MDHTSRYAIYYAPAAGSGLAEFGASWLGWDAQTGQSVAHPAYDDLPMPVSEMTAVPRKYGFHGTLKPPFRLARGKTVADLNEAVAKFAFYQPPFEISSISLQLIGGFLAITPDTNCPKIEALAGSCVRDLDEFRAPLSKADIARRRAANLSKAQDYYLEKWGYPYVFDEFRFHLTLTGKLPSEMGEQVLARLESELSLPLSKPLPVREICLFRENSDGKFHVLKRHALQAGQQETRRGNPQASQHFG